jgi:hypothetical protein
VALALLPGDVVVTRSRSLLGYLIRLLTTRPGDPVERNHGATIASCGSERTAMIAEQLWRSRVAGLWECYGPPAGSGRPSLAIYRLPWLTAEQRQRVSLEAAKDAGAVYGWWWLLCHAADSWLSRRLGRNVYVFRRAVAAADKRSICTRRLEEWLGPQPGAGPGEILPGVPLGCSDPDDWDDYCRTHGERLFAGVLGDQER